MLDFIKQFWGYTVVVAGGIGVVAGGVAALIKLWKLFKGYQSRQQTVELFKLLEIFMNKYNEAVRSPGGVDSIFFKTWFRLISSQSLDGQPDSLATYYLNFKYSLSVFMNIEAHIDNLSPLREIIEYRIFKKRYSEYEEIIKNFLISANKLRHEFIIFTGLQGFSPEELKATYEKKVLPALQKMS